jgi:hypothetical protein
MNAAWRVFPCDMNHNILNWLQIHASLSITSVMVVSRSDAGMGLESQFTTGHTPKPQLKLCIIFLDKMHRLTLCISFKSQAVPTTVVAESEDIYFK